MARFFKNVGALLLVFVTIYLPLGIFAFILGESTYGMKNRETARFYADIANTLAGIWGIVIAAIMAITYIAWRNAREETLFPKLIFICASFLVGVFLYMFAIAYPFHLVLAILAIIPGIILLFIK